MGPEQNFWAAIGCVLILAILVLCYNWFLHKILDNPRRYLPCFHSNSPTSSSRPPEDIELPQVVVHAPTTSPPSLSGHNEENQSENGAEDPPSIQAPSTISTKASSQRHLIRGWFQHDEEDNPA
jgi:hypothetical protein